MTQRTIEEIEPVAQAAHQLAAESKPSGGSIYDHYYAKGVADALGWSTGLNPTPRLQKLIPEQEV